MILHLSIFMFFLGLTLFITFSYKSVFALIFLVLTMPNNEFLGKIKKQEPNVSSFLYKHDKKKYNE